MKVFSLARLTFSAEGHRPEVLIVLLSGFCLAFFTSMISMNPTLAGQIVSTVEQSGIYSREMLIYQGGLFYGEICVYIIGFLIGMNLLFSDQKYGILEIILARSVSRKQYLLGKFFGAGVLSSICYLIMILPILVVALYNGFTSTAISSLLTWFFLTVKVLVLFSLILFFLQRTTRLLAPILGVIMIIIGFYSKDISYLQESTSGLFRWLMVVSYYLIPHLTEVTIATIFHPDMGQIPYTSWLVVYGLVYPAIFLGLSIILFKKKSL